MIDKYWTLHKQLYEKSLEELDTAIRRKVMSDPYCEESFLFNKKIKELTDKIFYSDNNG